MTAKVAFKVNEVVDAGEALRSAAAAAEEELEPSFRRWVEATRDVMHHEIPVDQGETRRSLTVQYGDGLSATIGPTNRDKRGRPVGFFINYGTGRQQPDDFIGRTARRAPALIGRLFDVSDVL